jgi:hypothetical protein
MTEQEMQEQITRAVAMASAGAILLEAAYAVKKSAISPELYAQLMNECIALSDSTALPFAEFETKAKSIMDTIERMFPMDSTSTITPEQRRRMI